MNKAYLLIFAVFLALGFIVYFYRATIQASLLSLTPLTQPLQAAVTKIQSAWTAIPDTLRGIILLGIPTAFAMFFGWTKTRAMTQLQETQEQAATRINELQGLSTETLQQNTLLQEQKQTLESQVSTLSEAQANVSSLTQTVDAQKLQIEKLISERNEAERLFNVLRPKEEATKIK